jgi:hypothetical protein
VHVGGVDGAAVQVEPADGPELDEQHLVQGGPDPGLDPVPYPPPAGHPGAAQQIAGQLVPGDAGLEHEHDATQARCHPDARAVLARRNAAGEKPSESSSADSPTSSTER